MGQYIFHGTLNLCYKRFVQSATIAQKTDISSPGRLGQGETVELAWLCGS